MSEKQFKYADQITGIKNCPPKKYEETGMTAFRFVREDVNHPDNFKPVGVLQPNRVFPSRDVACMSFGLSMFDKEENARAFFVEKIRKFPRFGAIAGNHLATLNLLPEDGVASRPEELNIGHFTFHEYIWCDFLQKIQSTAPL